MQQKRRDFLQHMSALALGLALAPARAAESSRLPTRAIPSDGAPLPIIGFGTWRTFNVELNAANRQRLLEVLQILHAAGGTMLDTSPMYEPAEAVLGELSEAAGLNKQLFFATKVWTQGRAKGIAQMEESLRLLRRQRLELMQVHNLLDWQTHWPVLEEWKAAGKLKYHGLTHYVPSSFEEMAAIMHAQRPDFIQIPYSIAERAAEQRILPLAQELGIAVIVNRPYEGGSLFRQVRGQAVPEWAAQELDCASWGQFFLKFILAHPAVTCVIPGTGKVKHAHDNIGAGFGPLPDERQRRKMLAALQI